MLLVLGDISLQIVSDFLHTPQVTSGSLCLPFCLIIYHTKGTICQRRGPVFRDYRAKHSSPSGSPRLEANEDSLLQSHGVYYLSKVPSIWRVPPPLPGHELDVPSHDGRSRPEKHVRLSVAVLGWARRSYAVHVDCPPFTTGGPKLDLRDCATSHCPAVPIRGPRVAAVEAVEASRASRPVWLAIQPRNCWDWLLDVTIRGCGQGLVV